MSTISLGRSGIVGISYGQTSLLKSSLKRASEKNNSAISKVNGAKLKLQVDRGSNRIRVEADNLQSYYRRLKSNNTRIEKAIRDIDYIVRRIREVDNKCANAIKSIGTSYKIKSSISKVASSLISLGNKVVKTTSSFFSDGINAIKTMYDSTVNWLEKHPLAANILSAGLNVVAVAGTVFTIAGAIAAAPVTLTVGAVVGVVSAVVGGVLAVNGLINDGVKIYNNIKNGNNKGFDAIETGLKKALGDKAGATVYGAVNVLDLALNIPHMVKGLAKGGKSLIKASKSIKSFPSKVAGMIGDFKGVATKYADDIAAVFKGKNGLSPKLAGGGTLDDIKGIGKVKIDDVPELNDIQKNYNKIVNGGKSVETSYVKSIADLKNTDKFKDGALEHILEGELNARGKAVGFHYEGMPTAKGNIIPGTESVPNEFGVYTAKVEVNGVPKTGNGGASSFFPKTSSEQDIVDAINHAYNNRVFKSGNEFYGYSANGMKIKMYIDANTKQIISAFPEY